MTHNTYTPRRKDWKTIINERIDLYKAASRSGDTTKADFILLHDHLAHEDHYRTITWEEQLNKGIDAAEKLHKLHAIADVGVHKVASMYHDVHESMVKLRASGETSPKAWDQHLDDQINKNEKKTHAMWEDARKQGHDAIKEIPQEDQDGAANIFISAMGAVADFAAKAANWLKDAVASVVAWLRNVWQKIVDFGKSIANWFTSAFHAVQGWFRGGENNNFAILASGPAVNVPTDSGESHPEGRNRVSSDGRHVDDRSHYHAGGDDRHSERVTSE